jgi:alcohol dehydrogenase class IV
VVHTAADSEHADGDFDVPASARPGKLASVTEIGDLLAEFAAKSVFLVLDRPAWERSGAQLRLVSAWTDRRVVEFDAFECNPRLDDVLKGVEQFRGTPCDVMVAIGGGTAIDVAKLIRCFATTPSCSPTDMIADNQLIELPTCPLIAVPTTAGTGSEATHFAVLYCQGVKHSIAHAGILPDVAVVDWRLTQSLPPRITAVTGLDALSQAIESVWSLQSTAESIGYACEAIELIRDNLETAVRAPNATARAAMSHAAHLAGKAINISKTTAPHAISYKITHDFGIPHGHAVALTLGPILTFNAGVTTKDVTDGRGLRHVREMIRLVLAKLGCPDAAAGRVWITDLMTSIGCETRLGQLGISGRQHLVRIAESVNLDRLRNNPRQINIDQLLQLLESIQ